MYAGRKVEEAPVEALFAEPLHPYTRGLMRAIPRLDVEADAAGTRPRLQEIPGLVPALTQPIAGCAFAPRCGFATERCRVEPPPLVDAGAGHTRGLLGSRARAGERAMSERRRSSRSKASSSISRSTAACCSAASAR